jgi:hypothetical protein
MRDARRRPYVDRVRPGNKAGGAPERGAGIGATWSRGPLAGCDRGADQARRFERRSMRVTGGQIPEGRLTTAEQGPQFIGDATRVRRKGSPPTIACEVRSPKNHRGPSSALRRSSSAPRRAPSSGMRPRRCAMGTRIQSGALGPLRGRPTLKAQALLRPPRAVLAATRRDGAIWAHLVVGNPCNIDISLRVILLKLHPTSSPSHTCPLMR